MLCLQISHSISFFYLFIYTSIFIFFFLLFFYLHIRICMSLKPSGGGGRKKFYCVIFFVLCFISFLSGAILELQKKCTIRLTFYINVANYYLIILIYFLITMLLFCYYTLLPHSCLLSNYWIGISFLWSCYGELELVSICSLTYELLHYYKVIVSL